MAGASGATNTLELLGTSAAASVTATYNSLGLTHFGTIAFATGASNYATLKFTTTATPPVTITDFTGAHDTIDLTSLAFVSGSSTASFNGGSHDLIVSNGTNTVTLQLGGGAYSGIGFTASSDGATGTDLTIGSAAAYVWTGGSANWQTATNWSTGVIPGTAASATIANAGSNTVTISSGESIKVAGLTLSNADTLLVAGTFAPTGAVGVTGALLSIASAGSFTNAGTLSNAGTLTDSGTFTNAGRVTGAGTGVILTSGARVTNQSGATIAGTALGVSGSGVVQNAGDIAGGTSTTNAGVYLTGGTLSNQSSGTITGFDGVLAATGPATVVNTGSIAAALNGYGIYLLGGGSVTNTSGGTISGNRGVVANTAAAAVMNLGAIEAGYVGVVLAAGGSVVNAGVINGGSNFGVALITGGSVTNQSVGTIVAGNAAVLEGAGDTLVNAGVITGSSIGVVVDSGGSVTNQSGGTISGGTYAVSFAADHNARLVVDPGAVFIGTVYGGNTIGAASISTLALASGASAGTLSGLGTKYIYFAQVTVDAGAQWTLSNTNALYAGDTLTDAGTLTVSGSLANAGSIAVDPPLVVSGTLVNSGTISAVLANPAEVAVSVVSGGVLTNSGTGAIVGGPAVPNLDNTTPVVGYPGGNGVDVSGGSVTNQARITGGAGGRTAYGYAASYYGGAGGAGVSLNSGSLINAALGVVIGGGGGYGGYGGGNGGSGVVLAGGSLSNQGTILGGAGARGSNEGGGGGTGVYVTSAGQVVNNQGTILGGAAAPAAITGLTGGLGVLFNAGGTLIDAGFIGGGAGYGAHAGIAAAVYFRGTGSDLLILEQGYTLHGAVVGSASASDTLELLGTSAGNAVTATYNSLGLTNFGTVAFASGAGNYATLKLTSTTALPGTITNFTGVHDTIVLSGLAYQAGDYTSFNTIGHTLRLSSSGGSGTLAQLQLGGGSYANVSWTVLNDGGAVAIAPVAIQTSFTIHNEAELNAAIGSISLSGADFASGTDYTLIFANGFALTSAVSTVSLGSGSALTINGAGFTLDGGGAANNFLNDPGLVSIENLSIVNAQATAVGNAVWQLTGVNTLGSDATLSNSGSVIGAPLTLSSGHLTNTSAGYIGNSGIYGTGIGGADVVLNQGTIVGAGSYAITLEAGETVTNAAGGLINGIDGGIKLASTNASLVNLGAVEAAHYALYLAQGGQVSNGNAGVGGNTALVQGYVGVYFKSASPAATVQNYGSIIGSGTGNASGVIIVSGGTVNNGSRLATSGLIEGYEFAVGIGYGTVNNYATISTSYVGVDALGVYIHAAGTVNNLGTAALIKGGGYGVDIGAGSVANNGTIESDSGGLGAFGVFAAHNATISNLGTAALILGGAFGVGVGSGTVTNQGTIASDYGGFGAAGVYLHLGGTVSNLGTAARIAGGEFGAWIKSGTVANYGTITSDGGSAGAYGLIIANAGSVGNFGTAAMIEGGEEGVGIGSGSIANYGTLRSFYAGFGASGAYVHAAGTVSNIGTAAQIEGGAYGVNIGFRHRHECRHDLRLGHGGRRRHHHRRRRCGQQSGQRGCCRGTSWRGHPRQRHRRQRRHHKIHAGHLWHCHHHQWHGRAGGRRPGGGVRWHGGGHARRRQHFGARNRCQRGHTDRAWHAIRQFQPGHRRCGRRLDSVRRQYGRVRRDADRCRHADQHRHAGGRSAGDGDRHLHQQQHRQRAWHLYRVLHRQWRRAEQHHQRNDHRR